MAKPNPFAGKKAPPFEKSGRDKDPPGMKEGGARDMALDRAQRRAPPPMAPPMGGPAFRRGGKVSKKK